MRLMRMRIWIEIRCRSVHPILFCSCLILVGLVLGCVYTTQLACVKYIGFWRMHLLCGVIHTLRW